MVGIRFGETIKAYVAKYGDASRLTAIPLGIAGWLRYMLAVDDDGKHYELAPDPMNEEIGDQLKDIVTENRRHLPISSVRFFPMSVCSLRISIRQALGRRSSRCSVR